MLMEPPALQAEQSQMSQPFLKRNMFQAPKHPCSPPLDSIQNFHVFLELESTEMDTAQHSGCGLTIAEQRGRRITLGLESYGSISFFLQWKETCINTKGKIKDFSFVFSGVSTEYILCIHICSSRCDMQSSFSPPCFSTHCQHDLTKHLLLCLLPNELLLPNISKE